MLPTVAAVGCILFIVYLFWTDLRRPDSPSKALWVPLAWMFLAGSRWVSSWLNVAPTLASASDYAEGSPLDRAVFFGLIMAGILILSGRRINWGELLVNNKWIVLYLLFCLASIAWTEEPFILVKRWFKDLGNPIMALVILTERRPYEAVMVVLRRLAFLLLPLSVLFIRYYPELARSYRPDGSPMYTGVGHQKNDLGLMCLLAGLYLYGELLQRREQIGLTFTRQHKIITVILIGMLTWLLHMSDSQTAVACLFTAVLVLLLGRVPFMAQKPSRMVGVLFFSALAIWFLNDVLHVKELVLSFLGRNPTLTNRTEVWETLEAFAVNPVIGTGFMSFWSGERLDHVWRLLGAGINQAHNGYLEQYLNLGYVGVAFIIVIMVSGLLSTRNHLIIDPAAGMLRLCFILSAALYNFTEASFYGMNDMWMLLLLGCLEVSSQNQSRPATNSWSMATAQARVNIGPAGTAEKELRPTSIYTRYR